MGIKILAVFAMATFFSIAHAAPTVKTAFIYYDIHPSTSKDLGKEIRRRSPIERDGKRYSGFTEWRVNWNYKWKSSKGACQVTHASTTLQVTYTMPRVAKGKVVSKQVYRTFKSYYSSLMKHEEGHMQHGLLAAKEIENALLNLGAFNSCEKLKVRVKVQSENIIKKYKVISEQYDKETNHGMSQGVAFRK